MANNGADLEFPPGWLWGCATSAHQVEGGNLRNQWWQLESQSGAIRDGHSAEIACDHWRRYREDFSLLSRLRQGAYRMSIEWSRVVPEAGRVDAEALQRYVEMVDDLLARGIVPFVTLLHFTVPAWWHARGGFHNLEPSHLAEFERFVDLVVRALDGRVQYWITINEPEILLIMGYLAGWFPPRVRSLRLLHRATRGVLRLHGLASRAIRRIQSAAQVGLAKNMPLILPWKRDSRFDRWMARGCDFLFNGALIQALATGRPSRFLPWHEPQVRGTLDFIGLNYYAFGRVRWDLRYRVTEAGFDPDLCCSGLGWQPYPYGLRLQLRRLAHSFPELPLYVTENGLATADDRWRRQCLIAHLEQCHQAFREGLNLRGYFYWSLLDNFEWNAGYHCPFGLVHVDRASLARTPRDSAWLYAEIAAGNRLTANQRREHHNPLLDRLLPDHAGGPAGVS